MTGVGGPVRFDPGRLRAVLGRDRAEPCGIACAKAAVLVALTEDGVLLTRRAQGLRRHAGQVAFPGGMIDPGDASPEAAALREAAEEVGLAPGAVEILGRLPGLLTISDVFMIPVVARVIGRPPLVAAEGEVARIFTLDLAVLTDPAAPERREWRGDAGVREFWVWPHPTEFIWGATGIVLKRLAAALAQAA